jgi:Taurine catabolism dioxygenase TauD, TfdA family
MIGYEMSRVPYLIEKSAASGLSTPAVWRVEATSAPVSSIAEWMLGYRDEIVATLHADGALVLRGFPQIREPQDYEQVISAAFPHLRDYVGGSSPRTKLHGRIMTATETPPDWSIPLHQEMAYTTNGPHRIAFLCLVPAPRGGGLSLLGDMSAALEAILPDVRDEFERRGLRLRRVLPSLESAGSKAGIKKNWQEVFDTEDTDVVDAIAGERGWECRWLDDATLQLTQELMPATRRHPVTGREVWHNQAHFFAPACMIEWAARDHRVNDERELRAVLDTRPDLADNVLFGDGEPVPGHMALAVSRSLRSLERGFALQRGDVLIIDNIQIAHGRSPFTGERKLIVALADEPGWRAA